MLIAYFDDSGTHADAPVVVCAGFIGDEAVWASLEIEWHKVLDREQIEAFHLAECEAGEGAFSHWSRARRDMVIHDLRQIILDRPLFGVCLAVVRPDWDELVIGEMRDRLGDAEQFCVKMCVHDAIELTHQHSIEDRVAIVFDNRPDAAMRFVPQLGKNSLRSVDLVSVTFGETKKIIPLQAADMNAWENYQYAQSWLSTGGNPKVRPHFQNFLEKGLLKSGIAHRKTIRQLIELESEFAKIGL